MKILYLVTDEPDLALQTILAENKKEHTVEVINLKNNTDYNKIIEAIEQFDRVISW